MLVDCVWDAWVHGTCTGTSTFNGTTCGNGTQTNTRNKTLEELYGGTCTGNSTEDVSCEDVECPFATGIKL